MKRINAVLIGAFSIVSSIVHGEAYSENTELLGADPIVIAADAQLELDVAAGATVTVSRVISGAGKLVKKGGGTLILAARNLFEGGVDFAAGDIWVRSEGALGSGQVTFTKDGVGSIIFEAPDATFDNEFLVDAKTACPKQPKNKEESMGTFVFFSSTTLNGDITFRKGGYGGIGPGYEKNDVTVVFNGNISAPAITKLYLTAYGTMIFNGWIKAQYSSLNTASSADGIIRFNNPGNKLGQNSSDEDFLEMYSPRVICGAPNVISNAYLRVLYNYKNMNYIDFNGYDQVLKALIYNHNERTPPAAPGDGTEWLCVKSDKPALLTLTGTGANNTTYCHHAFANMVSVTLDADPTYTLVLSNRTHSLRGGITVSNGTMRAVNATSFPNMTFLNVSEGAEFSLSTSVANAMRSVVRSRIEGTLTLESTEEQNLANCDMEIGESASLYLPESSPLKVRTLSVNGVKMQEGTYGPEQISQLKSGSVKVSGQPWPEIAEPVYLIEVAGGTTNRLDEMTVSVTQNGETKSVAFAGLTPTVGTVRKVGEGVVFSSQALSDFTGKILVEEGVFAVDDKLQTGPTNAVEAAEIWVKDGASFMVSGSTSKRLYNKFHLSGEGHNGFGAIYTDTDKSVSFYDAEWHLDSDVTVGIKESKNEMSLYSVNIYMNRHSMHVNMDKSDSNLQFDRVSIYAAGNITVVKGGFQPQGNSYWYSMEKAYVTLTDNAYFTFYNSKSYNGENVSLRFAPGGTYKWCSGGKTDSNCMPGDIDINWWNGSVVVDGTVRAYGSSDKKGLDLRGKVSGSGLLKSESEWLHLKNPENDFSFDLLVVPSKETKYKDFENGLAVYANGALPLSCRGVTITNGVFQLYDDARFDLPKLEYCAKGETNLAFSCSSDVKGGTLVGLKKTGTGTLSYEVSLAITGVVEVVEGVLDTDGETLKVGTLVPNAGRIDGDVEVLNGVSCAVASVEEGKVKKLTVNGNVTFAENSKLDIDELVSSGALARWSEPNVLIEADSIDGVPVIDPDSEAAQKHWRVSVSGGELSISRTYGTVFSIR